jgi:hypothetical protein
MKLFESRLRALEAAAPGGSGGDRMFVVELDDIDGDRYFIDGEEVSAGEFAIRSAAAGPRSFVVDIGEP